ncbi:predicted protein [Lichtheimia corymbifera JMRC:FSU:9682]|uniref:RNA polymerase II elongation factor ELL N-terminal domain-containing protein n=1 Tax=Lichtheimia corymbifera JMRC:FSU:9682 TaxID=1263082 RepID=A0A068S0V4_9FUNG|nr:predicted protein [Lichtheimia corymbifera JMRC:FSU:9682]
MPSTKRAIALRLNREALDLLQNSPDKIKLDLNQDNGTSLVIGNKRFSVKRQEGHIPYQLYRGFEELGSSQHGTTSVELVANVLQVLNMKQVLSKEDKSRFRSLTEAAEREKNARRTELLPNVPKLSSSSSSTSSSPRNVLVGATPPTRRPISSASPVRSTSKSKSSSGLSPARPDPAYVASVRERLIHLLAIYPHPLSQLTTKLKIRESDLMPILKKAAVESQGSWCLRPEVYKDLRIWEWKRYDDKERSMVIKNAEDAYDALKLPRNTPERNNLVTPRKKATSSSSSSTPQTASLLQPPPSQRVGDQHASSTTPTTPIKSPGKRPASSTSTTTTTANGNHKHDEKRIKTEKSSKSKNSSSTSSGTTTTTARHSPQKATTSTKHYHKSSSSNHLHPQHTTHSVKDSTVPPPLAPSHPKGTSSSSGSSSSDTDSFYEEEQQVVPDYEHPFVVSPITTQAQFLAMCKSHDEAQAEYIQLKRRISKDHPHYLYALDHVEAPRDIKDEAQRRDMYYAKVKAVYRSQGGNDWRTVMQLTRQFNHQLRKVNALWNEVERAFHEHQFALPTKR